MWAGNVREERKCVGGISGHFRRSEQFAEALDLTQQKNKIIFFQTLPLYFLGGKQSLFFKVG